MAIPYWLQEILTFGGNHLWQSTLFAAATALLALAFHRYQARVRCWLWLAASIKFLIPFAVLAAIGSQVSWRTVDVVPYENPAVLAGVVSEPFSQEILAVRPGRSNDSGESWLTAVPAVLPALTNQFIILFLYRIIMRRRR